MTLREKQIDEFANSQVDCEFFNEDLYKGIIIGAKWADEHPKSEMVNKEEFIEKVVKYLEANFPDIENTGGWYKESFINNFRKTMEE